MHFGEYQKQACTTAIYPGQGEFAGLTYVALGLNGEAGETAEKIKKAWRDDDGEITDDRRDEIIKELGDTFWYAAQICTEINISMSEVAERNLIKLADRRRRGMTSGSGDNR
jgi:NTP pyrophosphatase (non-canonical NTP hydrolase)